MVVVMMVMMMAMVVVGLRAPAASFHSGQSVLNAGHCAYVEKVSAVAKRRRRPSGAICSVAGGGE